MTNKTPVGTYRGPGRFEANFFRERLLDLMAADLGLDPGRGAAKNLLTPAEMPYGLGQLVPYEARERVRQRRLRVGARAARSQASDYPRLAALNGSWSTAGYTASASAASSSRAAPARRRRRASS